MLPLCLFFGLIKLALLLHNTNEMFSSNKNIESINQILLDFKEYFKLRSELFQLGLVEKITLAVSSFVLFLFLLIICAIVLLFVSIALVFWLSPNIGGFIPAFLIVAAIYLIIGIILYFTRRILIINPIANLLTMIVVELNNKINNSK